MRRLLFVWAMASFALACGPAEKDLSHMESYDTLGRPGQQDSQRFPSQPEVEVTPGALCEDPDEYRYAERIPYCERDVSKGLKRSVIKEYDQKFHYNIEGMPRNDFKIDHFIPLSVGGSNDRKNLWPQHESVYVYTDPIESTLSELMIRGKITQAEAIEVIKEAKFNLDLCGRLNDQLAARMRQQN